MNASGKIFVLWFGQLVTLCQAIFGAQTAYERASAERIVMQLRHSGYGNYLSFKEGSRKLSNHERSLVVEFHRESIDRMTRRNPNVTYNDMRTGVFEMALLGDDWAIIQVANNFLMHETRATPNEMRALCSPKAIPLIGEALFKEEKLEMAGDVGLAPTQVIVKEVILHTLGNSPEFSEEVINWARRVELNYNMKMMREWYRANESKLKAWDFKSVQPGAEPAESRPTDQPPPSPPPSSPSATAPVSSPANTQTQDSSGSVFTWSAALLLAACGFAFFFWFTMRRRK